MQWIHVFLETEDEFYYSNALKAQSTYLYKSGRLPYGIVNLRLLFYNMAYLLFPSVKICTQNATVLLNASYSAALWCNKEKF